jgi:hypothetical protein
MNLFDQSTGNRNTTGRRLHEWVFLARTMSRAIGNKVPIILFAQVTPAVHANVFGRFNERPHACHFLIADWRTWTVFFSRSLLAENPTDFYIGRSRKVLSF